MTFDLDALVEKAQKMIQDTEPELVPVTLAGSQVGIRYLPMSGRAWRDHVLQFQPRPEVMQDLRLGYNVDAVVSAYPDVAIVDDDHVDDMIRRDAEGAEYSMWPKVWDSLSATGRKDVIASIWAAHERTPERLVVEAGKASAGSRKKKRS